VFPPRIKVLELKNSVLKGLAALPILNVPGSPGIISVKTLVRSVAVVPPVPNNLPPGV
jgi:hypothetical protein